MSQFLCFPMWITLYQGSEVCDNANNNKFRGQKMGKVRKFKIYKRRNKIKPKGRRGGLKELLKGIYQKEQKFNTR